MSLDTPATTIVGDHPCLKCGYSLRGLPEDGVCPECGGLGFRGTLVSAAGPAYVRRLILGAGLFVVASLVQIVLHLGGIQSSPAAIADPMRNVAYQAQVSVWTPLFASLLAAWAVGWWLLSTPSSAMREAGTGRWSRLGSRVSVALVAVGGIGMTLRELAWTAGMPSAWTRYHAPTSTVLIIAEAAFFFGAVAYILVLAGLLGRERLARCARVAMTVGGAVALAYAAMQVWITFLSVRFSVVVAADVLGILAAIAMVVPTWWLWRSLRPELRDAMAASPAPVGS